MPSAAHERGPSENGCRDHRLGDVLITSCQIRARLKALATQIRHDYRRKRLALVVVLKGSIFFAVDLVRLLQLPMHIDFVSASSYPDAAYPTIALQFADHTQTDFQDRHVLIVDDILDTGSTLARVITEMQARRPRSIRTCVLLNKRVARTVVTVLECQAK